MLLEQLHNSDVIIEGFLIPRQVLNEGFVQWILQIMKKLGKAVRQTIAQCLQNKGFLGAAVLAGDHSPGNGCRNLSREMDDKIRKLAPNDPSRKLLEQAKSKLDAGAQQLGRIARSDAKAARDVAQRIAAVEQDSPLSGQNGDQAVYQRAGSAINQAMQELAPIMPMLTGAASDVGMRVAISRKDNPQISQQFDKLLKFYEQKYGPELALRFTCLAIDQQFSLKDKPELWQSTYEKNRQQVEPQRTPASPTPGSSELSQTQQPQEDQDEDVLRSLAA
jgi:hypothetical protein